MVDAVRTVSTEQGVGEMPRSGRNITCTRPFRTVSDRARPTYSMGVPASPNGRSNHGLS